MLPGLIIKKVSAALVGVASSVFTKNRLYFSCVGTGSPAQHLYDLLSVNKKGIDKVKSFAARTGSAGAGFKLIFQFQNRKNEVVSYIKVGDPVYRAPFLLNEKKILEYLNACSGGVQSPRAMGYKEHKTFSALEISAMKRIRYFPRPAHKNVSVLLANLCKKSASEGSLEYGKEAEGLVERYLEKQKTREFVRNSIRYLTSHSFPRPLSHRDLAGWNLFFCENGKLGILDWEFARFNHLPFQDLFHYFLHTKIHNSRLSPVEAFRNVFEKSAAVRKAIDVYAGIVGISDPELQRHLMVGYLWDWYSLERSREGDSNVQGKEYLEILDWLAER